MRKLCLWDVKSFSQSNSNLVQNWKPGTESCDLQFCDLPRNFCLLPPLSPPESSLQFAPNQFQLPEGSSGVHPPHTRCSVAPTSILSYFSGTSLYLHWGLDVQGLIYEAYESKQIRRECSFKKGWIRYHHIYYVVKYLPHDKIIPNVTSPGGTY